MPNTYFKILYHSGCNVRTKKETSKKKKSFFFFTSYNTLILNKVSISTYISSIISANFLLSGRWCAQTFAYGEASCGRSEQVPAAPLWLRLHWLRCHSQYYNCTYLGLRGRFFREKYTSLSVSQVSHFSRVKSRVFCVFCW